MQTGLVQSPQPPASREVSIRSGTFLGASGALALAGILYGGAEALSLPQPYFDLFDRVSRILPGSILTFAIDSMVSIYSKLPGVSIDVASKATEQTISIILFVFLGGVFGAIVAWAMRRTPGGWSGAYVGAGVALIPLVLTLLLEGFNVGSAVGPFSAGAWLLLLYAGWGWMVGTTLDWLRQDGSSRANAGQVNRSRRQFMFQFGGGAVVLALLGWGAGKLLGATNSSNGALAAGPMPTPTSLPPGVTPDFVAATGTRLEVTPNDRFYRVDVNEAPPQIDKATWKLSISGLVDNTFSLTYDQLKKMTSVDQDATLECISNPVGGDLISSTRWTGIKLADILKQAGVKSGVVEIKFTCADGYTESLPLESAMNEQTLVAYAMNGEALLPEHGFPVRLYTPNRYGMKNPKWLTGIEAINAPYNGYWENEGWSKEANIKTTSMIDAIDVDQAQNGVVPVGGIAFAGSRGINAVELSVDGGDWQQAQLKTPLSALTWRLWRFNWQAPKGHHTIVVRATDGTGTLQTSQEAPLHPDGASGYVSQTADVL